MFRSMIVLALAFSCLSVDASSAEQSPEMMAALQTLVTSQNLDKNWPLIVQSAGKIGAASIQRSALASLAANPDLTEAKRQKAAKLIEEWSVPMADEIDTLNRNVDAKALMSDMVAAVYPKYFTPQEIRQLAAFYGGKAFQKSIEIGIRVNEESGGQAPTRSRCGRNTKVC